MSSPHIPYADHDRQGRKTTVSQFSWRLSARSWLILLIPILFIALIAALNLRQPDSYRATATLLLLDPELQYVPTAASPNSKRDLNIAGSVIADAQRTLFSKQPAVSDKAKTIDWIKSAGSAFGIFKPRSLAEHEKTHFSYSPLLRTLYITMIDQQPTVAQDGANALAKRYIALRRQAQLQTLQQAIGKLDHEIASLEGKNSALLERLRDIRQKAVTKAELDLQPPEVRLLASATLPEHPVENASAQFGLAAAVGWLALCLGVIYGRKSVAARRIRRSAEQAVPAKPIYLDPKPEPEPDVDLSEPQSFVETQEPNDQSASVEPSVFPTAALMDHQRIVFMSDCEDGVDIVDLAEALRQEGQGVIIVSLAFADNDRAGLVDLIGQQVDYAELVQIDEETDLHFITAGTRPLEAEDFFSDDLHGFLLTLEQACDHVLIDMADHAENEFALKSLSIARDALACIDTPLEDPAQAEQLRLIMQHFGYQDCMILPHDLDGISKPTDIWDNAA